MPDYVVGKMADALNDDRKAINGSQVLVLGVAYKPNVGDVRESPALDVIHLLQERGAVIRYHDPFVLDLASEGFALQSVELTAAVLQEVDCVIVVTNHDDYDWEWVAAHAPLIVDTRNTIKIKGNGRVVRL